MDTCEFPFGLDQATKQTEETQLTTSIDSSLGSLMGNSRVLPMEPKKQMSGPFCLYPDDSDDTYGGSGIPSLCNLSWVVSLVSLMRVQDLVEQGCLAGWNRSQVF